MQTPEQQLTVRLGLRTSVPVPLPDLAVTGQLRCVRGWTKNELESVEEPEYSWMI